ncbi:uncharacterized protein LOC127870430 [Dreissena polymorpha]|uniref:Uncharacterized protein n=1 Tax=Dreissena polymorpha TaxID=45954 RepID=A0A9D4M8G8_DREPO|nr:uncharacterized protein LOC127870430 [Dreissena polymorpha]KAH3872827.1 hypothetical protein DPMN_036050 [Dreissena polymorpha]
MRIVQVVSVLVLLWATESALSRHAVEQAVEEKREEQLENLLERVMEQLGEKADQDDGEQEERALQIDAPLVPDDPVDILAPVLQKGCCNRGTTTVSLGNGRTGVSYFLGGVGQVIVPPDNISPKVPCSLKALLKVTFDKLPLCISGCLSYPLCGKRMLRVDLELSAQNRSGWLFNIGDSVSNNGYSGDSDHQTNDAEIDAIHPNVYVRPSDLCPDPPRLLATYTNAVQLGSVNRVTLFISNEHVRITNDRGLNQILCHKCLFALNGQSDPSSGGVNQDIYIALNRVISGGRIGVGVCSARLSWVCPENY